MLAKLDLPVIWLAVALGSVWALADVTGRGWGGIWLAALGLVLGLLSLGLILWAVTTMRAAQTAVMPGQEPARLVTAGPFAFSRNPIYLGMAGLVAAAALMLGAPLALLLVPVLMTVISNRFILAEEERLQRAFGADYAEWAARVSRWWRLSPQSGNLR